MKKIFFLFLHRALSPDKALAAMKFDINILFNILTSGQQEQLQEY